MYYNYNKFNQNTIFNFIIKERGYGILKQKFYLK